jgi:glycosyltransferase involved in cell wall biosynthesis
VAEEDLLPPSTGGRVDQVGFLDAAREAGISMTLFVPSREVGAASAYAERFPGVGISMLPRDERWRRQLSISPYVVASRPLPAELIAGISRVDGERDAVISLSVRVAHIGLALADKLHCPHLVRCQNLDSQYFVDIAKSAVGPRRLAYLVEARRLRRFESYLNESAPVTGFADVSSLEAVEHARRTSKPVVHVPVFALSGLSSPILEHGAHQGDRSGVVFVGSLDVETNVAALEWLLGSVWRLVRERQPAAELSIVGRRPSRDLRKKIEDAGPSGVELHADVPDVGPFLRRAAVAVNPVRTGAGISVKLLQGMAMGCACVSTSPGATGLDWVPGEHLLVEDSPERFAQTVATLLVDQGSRDRVASAGRAFVREHLDPQSNLEKIRAVLWGAP